MTDPAQIARLAEGLTKAHVAAFRAAKPHDDGELYVAAYSVPDRFTGSYCVYGRGDPLNRIGRLVAAHLTTAAQEKKDG